MRRSEGEEQGVGPVEGKKKKQTEDEQKERRSGRSRSNKGSATIYCAALLVLLASVQ